MVNIVLYYLNLFPVSPQLISFHRSLYEVEYQDGISAQQHFRPCIAEPCVVHHIDTAEAHCRAYHNPSAHRRQ